MTPPIASPHEAPMSSKPPFRGLRIFVAVDAAFLVLGPLISILTAHAPKQQILISAVGVIYLPLWGLLLWRLWHGSGAARAIFCWLNALFLVLAVFSHRHYGSLSMASLLFSYVNRAFLVFGLVWLQLPSVKAHFRRDGAV